MQTLEQGLDLAPTSHVIQIGSLYCLSSILMHLEWKKWRNQLTGLFLLAGPSLAKRGLKPFRRLLRHQMMFLGVKLCYLSVSHFHAILHIERFPTMRESRQSKSICKSYATQ